MKHKNNPFNIRKGSSHWLGSTSFAGDKFESFDTLQHGVRAFFIIMRTYSQKYGRRSIRSIITRFAPPSENNINNYINFVCSHFCGSDEQVFTGRNDGLISADFELCNSDAYFRLARAMAIYESRTYIPTYFFEEVWRYFHISTQHINSINSFPYVS